MKARQLIEFQDRASAYAFAWSEISQGRYATTVRQAGRWHVECRA